MFPIPLSRGIEIAGAMHGPRSQSARWYQTPVKRLIAQIGDIPVHHVTPAHLDTWHTVISTNGLSPWTVDSYTRALKSYFNKLVEAGHLESSPAARLPLYKLPKKAPKDIKEGDVEKMLKVARATARDNAIVRVLYDTGCRVGELISMTVSGVKFGPDGGRAIVTSTKTNRTRYIFFSLETAEVLKLYIDCRPVNAPDNLWLSHRGTNIPISSNGVYLMLRRLAEKAGISGRFNPHAFRHAAVKRWIDSGMPLKIVQELAGHQNISTTMTMYAVYDDEELEDYFHRFEKKPQSNND